MSEDLGKPTDLEATSDDDRSSSTSAAAMAVNSAQTCKSGGGRSSSRPRRLIKRLSSKSGSGNHLTAPAPIIAAKGSLPSPAASAAASGATTPSPALSPLTPAPPESVIEMELVWGSPI